MIYCMRWLVCGLILGGFSLQGMAGESKMDGVITSSYLTYLEGSLKQSIEGKTIQVLISEDEKSDEPFKDVYSCIEGIALRADIEVKLEKVFGGENKEACKGKAISDEIKNNIVSELKAKRIQKLGELLTKEVDSLDMGGAAINAQFVSTFKSSFKTLENIGKKRVVDLITSSLMLANAAEKPESESTKVERQLTQINYKLDNLNDAQNPKKLILFKELQQLEYMVLSDPEKNKQAREKEPIAQRADVLGAQLFPKGSVQLTGFKKATTKGKIDILRSELNHENWEKDMYWFGGSVMAVPSINAVTTGISMHVFPWYARAIQARLIDQDDGLRRFSVYFDVAAVTGTSNVNGRTYSNPSYGLGIGFDIREGFIIKAGAVYLKSSATGGVTTNASYAFQPSFGVTITREFFQDLLK